MVLEMTSFRLFLLALCSFCFALPLPLALPFCVASSFCSCFGYASRLRSCCSSGAALFILRFRHGTSTFGSSGIFSAGMGPASARSCICGPGVVLDSVAPFPLGPPTWRTAGVFSVGLVPAHAGSIAMLRGRGGAGFWRGAFAAKAREFV